MAYTRLILLSSLLAVVVDQTLAGKCKKGEVSSIAGTACYVVREPAPWALAEANCHSLVNGHLAVAGQDDYFELNGILRQQHEQNLGNSNLFWIGGRVESGSWKWSTYDQAGQHVYSGISNPSWDNGQAPAPADGQCVALNAVIGTWEAVDCDTSLPAICQTA